jgi:TolB-like protein/Tfp pilus assembly protein PilF
MSRQLAAILFSDIVGYTSMMGNNESATLDLVRQSREIQKPLVEKHHGIWLKEMGDGAMAQFKSALDAVRCAVEIQEVAAKELKAQLRIGVHLGDITIDNDEIYGDGINVASRIESIADPGSVFISEAVQGAIKGSDIHTDFRGEKRLKNVQDPVRVYKILSEYESKAVGASPFKKYAVPLLMLLLLIAFAIWKFSGNQSVKARKSIAVLPFELNNADSSNSYMIEGVMEELIRSLGKVNSLTVINPNSTLRFMASVARVSEAQAELPNSDYFLNGSFELNNNQIALVLELLNRDEEIIWTKGYQNDLSRLPELTGQVAVDITEITKIELSPSDSRRITEIPAMDPELFELLLKGKNHFFKFTPEDVAIGMNLLRQAKDKNPANSRAWSLLAEALVYMGHSPSPPPGVWKEAKAAAIRAIQLDSLNAEAWGALAHTKTYFEWDYDGAQRCYDKANSLNPNMAANHYHYSWHLYLVDSLDKALKEHKVAFELDPLDPFQSARLAHMYMIVGHLDSAVIEVNRALRLNKDFPLAHDIMGRIYIIREQYDSAEMIYRKLGPIGKRGLAMTYVESGKLDKGMQVIWELQEHMNPINSVWLAVTYAKLDSADRFFEYANYEPAHAFHPWLRVAVNNPKIIADPRFKQLMDKMNLPMPALPQEQP